MFVVREISICYNERRLDSFCCKGDSYLLQGEGITEGVCCKHVSLLL